MGLKNTTIGRDHLRLAGLVKRDTLVSDLNAILVGYKGRLRVLEMMSCITKIEAPVGRNVVAAY